MTSPDVDHERFARLWTRAQPLVSGYILGLIGDAHQAEDVLQNTAIVCLRKIAAYDESRPFAAWAIGIARLEALASKRSVARSPLSFQSDLVDVITEACEGMAEREPDSAALHRCLEQVRGRAWDALKLRYDDDLEPTAIGERLGMAAGAVRVLLTRVRAGLRTCIERRLREEGAAS
jgi:RNA polymerase sigma-70 factor (ECF subfamily)